MQPVLKLLLFFLVFALVLLAGYTSNNYFHKKITGTGNGWHLILYIVLMITTNIILTIGGAFALFKVYDMLTS